MVAVRITAAMVDDFQMEQLVPVFDTPPDDGQVIYTTNDFDIQALAVELRHWRRAGWDEQDFREAVRSVWPHLADVEFPDRRSWLDVEEAQALIELGVAEAVSADGAEAALEAWGI
jgi:hypothetical protein